MARPKKTDAPTPPARRGRPPKAAAAPVAETRATEVLPAPVAAAVIDEVVTTINGMARAAGFEFARVAGTLIVEKFYGGDLEAWRGRGVKDASFRALAKRADNDELAVSASVLYRAVAFVELEARLGVSSWKHLTTSHVRAVFGLPENHQKKLLGDAENKEWTVEDIEKAAAKIRKKEGDGRGRPRDPAFLKGIRRLGKLLDGDGEWFGELDQVETLTKEEAEALKGTVARMKVKCEELEGALAARG